MKTFSENNRIYEIIETRGSFYYGKDNTGKIKVVATDSVDVVEMDALPKVSYRRTTKAKAVVVDPIQSWKEIALSVNNKFNQNSTWKLAEQSFGAMKSNGNEFIESLLHTMFAENHLSEKQAYCLAKFGVESNQLK